MGSCCPFREGARSQISRLLARPARFGGPGGLTWGGLGYDASCSWEDLGAETARSEVRGESRLAELLDGDRTPSFTQRRRTASAVDRAPAHVAGIRPQKIAVSSRAGRGSGKHSGNKALKGGSRRGNAPPAMAATLIARRAPIPKGNLVPSPRRSPRWRATMMNWSD
jgi:hypothetical protein